MKTRKNASGYERLRIGCNIRKWRNIKEVKQKDLASALKMSEAAISNIENDLTDITLSQLEDISVTLDINIEQLFSDPQEVLSVGSHSVVKNENNTLMDKELIYALIERIEKKDEQLKDVFNNVIYSINQIAQPHKRLSKN
jgi:hypothetical protein